MGRRRARLENADTFVSLLSQRCACGSNGRA